MPVDEGPSRWLMPVIDSSYSKLISRELELENGREAAHTILSGESAMKTGNSLTRLHPGRNDEVVAITPTDYWYQRLKEYQGRKAASAAKHAQTGLTRGKISSSSEKLVLSNSNYWVPMGPAVITRGMAIGNPPVGGRVSRMAITLDGNYIYAASANGGIFGSGDGGKSWRSTMDGFDTDPTHYGSTSLSCVNSHFTN
jgi:hypothetical protein